MTKKQTERFIWLYDALQKYGVTTEEIHALLRCERALTRWSCRECGDGSDWAIERDETTKKPFNVYHGAGKSRRYPIRDLEAAALKRANAICSLHELTAYHQGDPRGCALYVLRPGDVRAGQDESSCYTNGVAICVAEGAAAFWSDRRCVQQ